VLLVSAPVGEPKNHSISSLASLTAAAISAGDIVLAAELPLPLLLLLLIVTLLGSYELLKSRNGGWCRRMLTAVVAVRDTAEVAVAVVAVVTPRVAALHAVPFSSRNIPCAAPLILTKEKSKKRETKRK
jgi:hypothetical protein